MAIAIAFEAQVSGAAADPEAAELEMPDEFRQHRIDDAQALLEAFGLESEGAFEEVRHCARRPCLWMTRHGVVNRDFVTFFTEACEYFRQPMMREVHCRFGDSGEHAA